MNQVTDISELKGKTIKNVKFVGYNEQAVIVFVDSTYAVFRIDFGYAAGEGDIELSIDKLNNRDKLEIGFISQEEYDLAQEKQEQKDKAAREARDRRQFEQFKKKYEGG